MLHLPAAGGPGGLDGTGDEGNAGPCAFPVERCIARRNLPVDANRLALGLHNSSQMGLCDVVSNCKIYACILPPYIKNEASFRVVKFQ
jgi:hypothetical protein